MNVRLLALTLGVLMAPVAPAAAPAQSTVLAPTILQLPASTRALGMGNVAIAGRDDDVLFYNPAQLVVARGTSAQLEWYPDHAHGGTVSSVLRFGNGGLAVGASAVDYQIPAPFTVQQGAFVPSGFDATSLVGSIGVGQRFKGFRVGAAAKYAEESFEFSRFAYTAADVGIARDVAQFVTLGFSVQNIGASSDKDDIISLDATQARVELPLRGTLGAAVSTPAGPFDLVATADAMYGRDEGHVRAAGGAELGWSWLSGYEITVRAGARDPEPGEEAFTAGAGFTRDRVSVDYALETLAGSRVAHRIGIRIRGP